MRVNCQAPTQTRAAIRCVLACTALWTIGCGTRVSDEIQRQVDEAEARFDAAQSPDDFLKVAGSYQRLVDVQPGNVGALYNQGNAFYRAGRKAEAIACYRKALRYRPRDENLQAQLELAVSSDGPQSGVSQPTGMASPQLPVHGLSPLERVFFWRDWLGYGEKVAFLLIVATATFLLAMTGLFMPTWRRRVPLWLGFVATAFCGAAVGYDYYRFEIVRHGVVRAQGTLTRTGPSSSYPTDFAVPFGVEFEIVETRAGAEYDSLIRLPTGQSGWLANPVVY